MVCGVRQILAESRTEQLIEGISVVLVTLFYSLVFATLVAVDLGWWLRLLRTPPGADRTAALIATIVFLFGAISVVFNFVLRTGGKR